MKADLNTLTTWKEVSEAKYYRELINTERELEISLNKTIYSLVCQVSICANMHQHKEINALFRVSV